MSHNNFDSSVTLRNIDILNSMAYIASNNLTQFYSRDLSADDYCHLFEQYFKDIFFEDVDSLFIPLIQNGERSDINVFFIKCTFFLKDSKARKPILVSELYDSVLKGVGSFLYEENLYREDSPFLVAMSDYFFDFLSDVDLGKYFDGLKDKYDKGLLVSTPTNIVHRNKIKTNLTVSELACLFRALDELKPGIFDIESKEELFNFISDSFESKRSSDLSTKSIKNDYYNIEQKARDLWLKHFSTLVNFVSNIK